MLAEFECVYSLNKANVKQLFLVQNPVGAGRYDIQKWDDAQHRNGHESVFKSKTGPLKPHVAKFLG